MSSSSLSLSPLSSTLVLYLYTPLFRSDDLRYYVLVFLIFIIVVVTVSVMLRPDITVLFDRAESHQVTYLFTYLLTLLTYLFLCLLTPSFWSDDLRYDVLLMFIIDVIVIIVVVLIYAIILPSLSSSFVCLFALT